MCLNVAKGICNCGGAQWKYSLHWALRNSTCNLLFITLSRKWQGKFHICMGNNNNMLTGCRFSTLKLIDHIADVLWQSFQKKIMSEEFVFAHSLDVPLGWSRQLAIDCEHMSYVLAIAYHNHSENLIFNLFP